MGAVITLAADSTTLTLNGRAFTSLGVGDYLELAPVNPLTTQTPGGDGGVTIQGRSDGGVTDVTVRVQKFDDDDVFLNSARNQSSPVVFDGSVKTNFVKSGTDGVESYVLESGTITTQPTDGKNDQDGNALMEYVIQFRNSSRNI